MTRRLLLMVTLILLPWSTPPASAHTNLVSITPAESSRVLDGWPPEVVLAVTEAIDPTLSAVSVSVDGQSGTRVPLGPGVRSTGSWGTCVPSHPLIPRRPTESGSATA